MQSPPMLVHHHAACAPPGPTPPEARCRSAASSSSRSPARGGRIYRESDDGHQPLPPPSLPRHHRGSFGPSTTHQSRTRSSRSTDGRGSLAAQQWLSTVRASRASVGSSGGLMSPRNACDFLGVNSACNRLLPSLRLVGAQKPLLPTGSAVATVVVGLGRQRNRQKLDWLMTKHHFGQRSARTLPSSSSTRLGNPASGPQAASQLSILPSPPPAGFVPASPLLSARMQSWAQAARHPEAHQLHCGLTPMEKQCARFALQVAPVSRSKAQVKALVRWSLTLDLLWGLTRAERYQV
jgi:hypothetical protein